MTRPRWFGAVALCLTLTGCASEDVGPACSGEPGTACLWAGGAAFPGFNPDAADRRESWLYFPTDLSFAADGRAYILDWNNHAVRRVEADDTLHVVIGADYEGDGPPGETDRLPLGSPPGAPGTDVALNHPTDIDFMPDGTVVLAAWHNNKLRVLDPTTGVVKVLTGDGYGFSGDGGPAHAAVFNQPKAVVVDTDGTIYTIDQRNERIRKIAMDAQRTVTTVAGKGVAGSGGDGGQALDAEFGFDVKPTPEASGALALRGRRLFVADFLNNRIRAIDLDTGIIDCVAGKSGKAGYSGDGGSAMAAEFNWPNDLEFGPDGRLYVADERNNAIRAIDLEADKVETVAGNVTPCPGSREAVQTGGSDGQATLDVPGACALPVDGVPALEIQLNNPYGIAFDAPGNLYIADTFNNRIIQVKR